MCGIVGVAGSLYQAEKSAFEDLLIFSQVRGPHSTGIATVARQDNKVYLLKEEGRPQELIDYDKRYDDCMGFNKKFILGHNRFATIGKITKKNAHPFLFSEIVGCHNGTIPGYALESLKVNHKSYDTDSEALLANLNSNSVTETMKHICGAWALVWFDVRNNTLNFLRNKERELFYVYSKDRKALFWASEKGFLQAALARRNIKYDIIYEVVEDQHMSWVIPEVGQEFTKPRMKLIVSDQPRQGGGHQGNYFSGHVNDRRAVGGVSGPDAARNIAHNGKATAEHLRLVHNRTDALSNGMFPANTNALVKQFAEPQDIKNFDGQGYNRAGKKKLKSHLYRGFGGTRLDRNQFEKLTKAGCCWCGEMTPWGKPVRFISQTEHICLVCNSDEQVVHSVAL